jgi:hypothetical protein
MNVSHITCIMLACGIATAAAELRTMRGAAGEIIRASLEGLDGENVSVRREDGERFTIPLERFAPEERDRIKAEIESLRKAADKINETAGHKIVDLAPPERVRAAVIAEALGLPKESETRFGSSWRRYRGNSSSDRLFGALPFSTALYSDVDGMFTHMSAVFSNKGDFGNTAGRGEDHFQGGVSKTRQSLEEAMAADENAITTALNNAIGEGTSQRFGDWQVRRRVTRWDWNGYSFILSHEPGEYVGLSMLSTTEVDGGGRTTRISGREIRERLLASVQRSDGGDVWIADIPMVDQGPKGYCVPATFERAMRTLGVDADMYLLAMIGETNIGGGTSVTRLLNNVRTTVRNKGRRTDEIQPRQLRIRDIKRRIDEGIPVMWTMNSRTEFNAIANQNTRLRQSDELPDQERMELMRKNTREAVQKAEPANRGHLCMIIGYNEETQELAVSDSWGPNYALRWVPIEAAQWVCNGHLFFILP